MHSANWLDSASAPGASVESSHGPAASWRWGVGAGGKVVSLVLNDDNLKGHLHPPSFAELTSLRTLYR
jgi:hypothetical protein